MERLAFHLRIEDGKRAAYLDAGQETDRVFEKVGHVFGYMEVTDPDAIRRDQRKERDTGWDLVMAPILVDREDPWMDEMYRMI